jgi:hypothetical protein
VANSFTSSAIPAFAAIAWLASNTPSSASEFQIKAHSGRCMHASTGEEIRTVATDECQNSLGFIAANLTGSFGGTLIGFRTAPAPAESFVCLHADLPLIQGLIALSLLLK